MTGIGILNLEGLNHIFTSFENVVAFLLSKELLEPIAECLQGQLQEVYFGFQKLDEVYKGSLQEATRESRC